MAVALGGTATAFHVPVPAGSVVGETHVLQVQPGSYSKFSSMLHDVDFNCLFARSVLEGLAEEEVWADSEVDPTLVHIIHSYGWTP